MATKEVMVTAPILVVLWDWVFAPRPLPSARRWLWAGLAATWVMLAMLVVNEHRAPSVDLGQGMAWRYLVTQAGVIVHYLRLAVFPSPLVFLYTWPVASSITALLPQLAVVSCLVALTVVALARRHPLGFAGAAFLLILAPDIQPPANRHRGGGRAPHVPAAGRSSLRVPSSEARWRPVAAARRPAPARAFVPARPLR